MGLNNQKIILVTAFEPFGGETMNPTEMILNKLPETIGSHRIRKALLPVDFERAPALAIDTYNVFAPDAVLMLGQAAGRSEYHERPDSRQRGIPAPGTPDPERPLRRPVFHASPGIDPRNAQRHRRPVRGIRRRGRIRMQCPVLQDAAPRKPEDPDGLYPCALYPGAGTCGPAVYGV